MSTIAQLLVGLGIDSADYETGIAGAEKSADGFIGKITNTLAPAVTGAFVAAGAATAAFAVTSVKAAGDFEAGMLNFASVTGSSITDAGYTLDDFQAKFLQLGAETAFSAAQAQDAAIELAKGGVAIPSIMQDATQATLDLASAGGLELGPAAGIVAKQLGVWASTGTTATEVANLLAQAANASTVDVDELAAGLANAQGTAKTAGVEYKDLVQTMAVLAPSFASANTAGTSLNNFLIRMQPATKDATDAMIKLGLATADGKSKFYDAQGGFIGMEKASQLMQQATKGLTEAQKTQMLQTIFGNDAMGAAVALATAGAAGFNSVGVAMAGAGTAMEQAAQKQQGFNFAMDSMMGSIETLQIIIGGYLLPIFTQFINTALIPSINAIAEFVTTIMTAPDPIQALIDVITPFSPLLAQLVGYIAAVATGSADMQKYFDALPAPIQMVVRAVEALIGIIGDNLTPILIGVAAVLGGVVISVIYSAIAAFSALAAPIIAAIAIAAAMYAAYTNNFLGIKDLVDNVVNTISEIITAVMNAVLAFWTANGNEIMATATALWNQLLATVTVALQAIWAIISTILNLVLAIWTKNGDQIMGVVMAMWNVVTGLFQAGLTLIQGISQMVIGILTGDWSKFAEGCATIVQGLMKALETLFVNGLTLVKKVFDTTLETIRTILMHFVGDANSAGGAIINGIIDGVKSGVGALVDAVRNAATKALNAAKHALGISSPSKVFYQQVGMPSVQGITNAFVDGGAVMSDALSSSIDGALGAAQRTIDTGLNATASTGIAAGAAAYPVEAVGAATGAPNGVTQNFNIDAHYKTVQDELTLRDRIRLESLLNMPSVG